MNKIIKEKQKENKVNKLYGEIIVDVVKCFANYHKSETRKFQSEN